MRNLFCLLISLLFVSGCIKQAPSRGEPSGSQEGLTEPGAARFPSITPGETSSMSRVTYRFRFESGKYKISVQIDEEVYQAARDAEKVALIPAELKDADLSAGFQSALIDDPSLEPFYEALLGRLRALKRKLGLDDDRYLELLITFVQQIEYCDDHADNPKFPIETFADKCGDCDDKSRLLAGLLSREGFEVVLLLFFEEQHMAVGLKAPPLDYKRTGYGYVETTSPALVGFLADENTNVRITSTPKVIPVGTGAKPYGKGKEIASLKDTFDDMKSCINDQKPELEERSEACKEGEAELKALKAALDRTPKSDPARRQAAVDGYNRGVDKFNRLVAKRNAVAAEINTCAEVYNHILGNAFDRRGVYRWVRSKLGE